MIPIFLVMKHLTGLCRFFRGVDKTDKTGIYAERHPRPHKEGREVFLELVILKKESINRGGQVQLHKQFFGETSTIMKVVSGIFVNLFQEILFLKVCHLFFIVCNSFTCRFGLCRSWCYARWCSSEFRQWFWFRSSESRAWCSWSGKIFCSLLKSYPKFKIDI